MSRLPLKAIIAATALAAAALVSIALIFQAPVPHSGRSAAASRHKMARLDFPRAGAHAVMRPVYPYSVLPGGAYDAAELRRKSSSDAIAARHYQPVQLDRLRTVEAVATRMVYVSYRKGNSIYWTRNPIHLTEGETLLTDGALYVRARCGNRISTTPQDPVSEKEPPKEILDTPEYWQPAPFPADPELPWQMSSRRPGAPVPQVTGTTPLGLVIFPPGGGFPIVGPAGSTGRGGSGTPGSSGSGSTGGGGSGTPGSSGSGSTGGGGSGTPGSSGSGSTGGGGSGTPGSSGSGSTGGGGSGTPGSSGSGSTGGGGSGTPGSSGSGSTDGGGTGTPYSPGEGSNGPGTNPGDTVPVAPVPEPGSLALLLTVMTAAAGVCWWNRRRASRMK